MDFSRFKTSDWLMMAGGLVMLISGLAFPWRSIDIGGISDSGDNAFDFFLTGGISWFLVVGAGIVALLLALGTIKSSSTPWPLILLVATGLATLLMLLRVILGAGDVPGTDGEVSFDRGFGMFIGLIAAALALAGAFMNFTAAGGSLRDLTNPDKLKGSFGR